MAVLSPEDYKRSCDQAIPYRRLTPEPPRLPELDPEAYKRMARDLPEEHRPVVTIKITLYGDGSMSTEAPAGDVAFCMRMLDEARDAIKRQGKQPLIIVPGNEVDCRFTEPAPQRTS